MPEFEIIRRSGVASPDEDVRPCEHGKFILDEEWATVTCGKCKQRVDPFAALMYYARFYQERIAWRFRELESSEKSLHQAELKRLSRLRDATDEEKREISGLTDWHSKATLDDLREAVQRIGRAIQTRKMEKRMKRRPR